ncbi:MAG TPA: hypothetical protein VK457_21360 [Chloroflexota bacterium]|nr:hypothetical protein [Chloroflexota bacterium]
MIGAPGLAVAVAQIGIITGVFLILCGGLAWWLYHRESTLSNERNEAERRAQQLVAQLLTRDQLRQLTTFGFIELRSRLIPGRFYRVPRRRGQVQVYEEGRHAGSLCIQPTRWVPDADLLVMHKVMIEGNEAEYLRTANFFKPYRVA